MANKEKVEEISIGFSIEKLSTIPIQCCKESALEMARWKDEQFKKQLSNIKDEIQNNLCASSGFNDEYSHGYQDFGMKVMEMIDKILN